VVHPQRSGPGEPDGALKVDLLDFLRAQFQVVEGSLGCGFGAIGVLPHAQPNPLAGFPGGVGIRYEARQSRANKVGHPLGAQHFI
jgi:hypothetical protein